jgi:uncharacterized integral membrane protein
MRTLRTIFDALGLLAFFAMMVLVYRNREVHTTIDLHFTRFERVPVSMVVLASMLAGSILALFFAVPEWVRLRGKLRSLREESRDGEI